MTHIEFKKKMLQQDIKFYRDMMKLNLSLSIIYLISICLIGWLMYFNLSSTLLNVLLGSLTASIIFIFNWYIQAKIDYKNALQHLSLMESSDDIETAKICELKYRINDLEGVIYAQRRDYESLRAANREASSMD